MRTEIKSHDKMRTKITQRPKVHEKDFFLVAVLDRYGCILCFARRGGGARHFINNNIAEQVRDTSAFS